MKISKYKPSALQARIDFSPVSGISFAGEGAAERAAMKAIVFIIIALMCGYLYFVTASVVHVMARREALAQINSIRGSIGTLEQEYFALAQRLTPDEGPLLGLAPVEETDYVYRPGSIGAATIASDEI
ncbi:MAG: hypothetical protein NUV59_01725 [Patescibacteria group bacterium]|nr:hypothetical protein [Patescibacteria group bacterium]